MSHGSEAEGDWQLESQHLEHKWLHGGSQIVAYKCCENRLIFQVDLSCYNVSNDVDWEFGSIKKSLIKHVKEFVEKRGYKPCA